MKLFNRFLSSIIKKGDLIVIDVDGVRHSFGDGTLPKCPTRN